MKMLSRTAMLRLAAAPLALLLVSTAAHAAAPPSVALNASICRASPLRAGQQIHGVVLHVPGADVVCIAHGPTPAEWTPVRLAQPARDRAALMSAAFAKTLTCRAGRDGRADCQVGGVSLASAARDVAVKPIAVAWR
jgi:hypothetical protein